MHIAWLGKKTPFCGNVTYSREVTNALLDRGYQVSFLHFAQDTQEGDRKFDWALPNSVWGLQMSRILGNDDEKTDNDLLDIKNIKEINHINENWSQSLSCEVPLPYLYKSQIYTIPSLKSSKVLKQSLKDLRPDIVHASLTLSPLDFLLPEICEELDLPLIATFHAPFEKKVRNFTAGTQLLTYQLYAPFLANYERVVIFSQIQKDYLVKLGVPEERIAIIPNGVDSLKYSPGKSSLKQELETERLFTYQGRIAPEKNVEALLKAWKNSDLGANSKLLIVGDGPLSSVLQANYNLEDNIIWFGFVGDEERRIEILRGSDVFILPSLVEGLSLSLLEAMSAGVACVATDAGADGEVLEEGAGIVLNMQRVTSELKTLLPVLRDQAEFTNLLGQKARSRVLERYTLRDNITRLEMLYAEVLGKTAQKI